jgi:para-nitrobenzyl esterase
MKRLFVGLLALTMIFSACSFAMAEESPSLGVVQTAYGLAQGVQADAPYEGVTLFKGIPYAAPPVGDLRFAAPQDAEAWDGVRVFDAYADAAMQWPGDMDSEPWHTDFYYTTYPTFNEDCLYLNVTTSASSDTDKLPVYIWMHGGGLNHGYSYEEEFAAEMLSQKGVVVVTVGHRLGVFGYIALPQLDAETEYGASGNYGVMDTIKAVDWVIENIAAFGGDPENITIGGQSGGTGKSGILLASDKLETTVKKYVFESNVQTGSFGQSSYTTLEDMETRSINYLKSVGLTGEETLEELRALPSEAFMGTPENYSAAPQSYTIDGYYVTYKNLYEAYLDGKLNGVSFLGGSNFSDNNFMPAVTDRASFDTYFLNYFGDELWSKYDLDSMFSIVNDENANDWARIIVSYVNPITSDLFGVEMNKLYGDSFALHTYLFSHRTPGRNSDYYWAWHSSELWYTFGSLRDIPEQRDWQEWDYKLADIMSSYWSNFIKTGDPNGEGLTEWPSADTLSYMNLGDAETIGSKSSTTIELEGFDDLLTEYVKTKYSLE